MYYTTHIPVNIGSDPNRPRPGRNWIRNRYRVHQRLWMAFPGVPRRTGEEQQRPFLFRVHSFAAFDAQIMPVIEVRSVSPPDLPRAFENAPFLVGCELHKLRAREEAPAIEGGAEFYFSLLANPSRKIRPDARKHGTRHGLRLDEELDTMAELIRAQEFDTSEAQEAAVQQILKRRGEVSAWMARKAEAHGFELVHPVAAVRENRMNPSKLWKENASESVEPGRGEKPDRFCHMRLDAVLYTGVLRVTGSDVFQRTLLQGIGSGKGFGFGLLSVSPV